MNSILSLLLLFSFNLGGAADGGSRDTGKGSERRRARPTQGKAGPSIKEQRGCRRLANLLARCLKGRKKALLGRAEKLRKGAEKAKKAAEKSRDSRATMLKLRSARDIYLAAELERVAASISAGNLYKKCRKRPVPPARIRCLLSAGCKKILGKRDPCARNTGKAKGKGGR